MNTAMAIVIKAVTIMNSHILSLMLAGGTFPTGGFSQSYGLETYVEKGIITNCIEFEEFLNSYALSILAKSEGPYFCEAYRLTSECSFDKAAAINRELTAMKLTREMRDSSHRTGKSFMRIASTIFDDSVLKDFYYGLKSEGINYSIAFSVTAARLNIGLQEALEDFFYTEVNNLVQAALKLIPLGNVEAQSVLMRFIETIDNVVQTAIATDIEDVDNFSPGIEIASIKHETLRTRLYMS